MIARRPTSTTAAAGATLLIVVVLLAAYVGGYFVLTTQVIEISIAAAGPDERWRDYRYEWIATAYKPMAWMESWMTGDNVKTSNTIYYDGWH